MKQAMTEQGRRPRRLGRGLSALIGEAVEVEVGDIVSEHKLESEGRGAADEAAGVGLKPKPSGRAAQASTGADEEGGAAELRSRVGHSGSWAPGAGVARGEAVRKDDLERRDEQDEPSGDEAGPGESAAAARAEAGVEAGGRRALVMVAVAEIVPSPWQPRRGIDQGAIERLAESIRHAGVMQPVVVRRQATGYRRQADEGARTADSEQLKAGSGARYELVAGERRWRAATMAGVARIPAVVVELTDEEAAEWGLVENLQREDLNAIERGWALRRLSEEFGMQVQEVATRLGLERSSVSNLVRLTELEATIAGMIERGELSGGHGKALLTAPAGAGRLALALRAGEQGWSVRRLEAEVKRWLQAVARGDVIGAEAGALTAAEAEEREKARLRAAAVGDLEKQLSEHLATKVRIVTDRSGTKGRIEVSFYDLDHFEAVAGKLGFEGR